MKYSVRRRIAAQESLERITTSIAEHDVEAVYRFVDAVFPRLLRATEAQRFNFEMSGDGYGIHWPDIDEDISVEGLLRGARSPRS